MGEGHVHIEQHSQRSVGTPEHGGRKGAAPLLTSKSGDKLGKCTLVILSNDIIFSHFHLTFVFFSSSFSAIHDLPQNATMVGSICL